MNPLDDYASNFIVYHVRTRTHLLLSNKSLAFLPRMKDSSTMDTVNRQWLKDDILQNIFNVKGALWQTNKGHSSALKKR